MPDKTKQEAWVIPREQIKKAFKEVYDDMLDKSYVDNQKGAPDGIATLNENGKVPDEQLPSYKDDISAVAEQAAINKTSIGLQKKNLLPYPKSIIKGGITFSCDNEGFMKSSSPTSDTRGWTSSNAQYNVALTPGRYRITFEAKQLCTHLSGKVLVVNLNDEEITETSFYNKYNGGVSFNILKEGTYYIVSKVFDGEIAIMIRDNNITNDRYEPYVDDLQTQINNITGETQTVTLSNDQEYPFNNSQQSVSLTTTRISTDYKVDTEIISPANGEQVGRIVITDKLTNGFKIAYTGGAKSVTLKCTVKGGMS